MIQNNVLPARFSDTITEIRKGAKLKQSDVANKLTVDASRISRIESGDISITFKEAEEILKVIDTDYARAYLEYLKQEWKVLDKPFFSHPQRESLYDAEIGLQKLDLFLEDSNLSSYLSGEAKMYKSSLLNNAQFLQSVRHSVAYIGDIGVGKTTAVCAQTNLTLQKEVKSNKVETVLEVGAGGTTVCEVRIRQGLQFSLSVEPVNDTEVYKFASELCAGVFESKETKNEANIADNESATKGVSKEIDRALRNMAGLGRQRLKGENRKIKSLDPLKELANTQDTLDALTSEVNQRLSLWKRTAREISYDKSSNLSEREWLQKIFKEINNGRHPEFSLPKRIDIIVPFNPLNISDYEIEIIDTKGVDQTAIRPDLQACIDDSKTIIILCSKFNDAPSTSIQSLIENLKKMEHPALNERIGILALPRPEEAIAVKDDSGEQVQTDEEGYSLKEEQIELSLGRIGSNNMPVHFFNSSSDRVEDLNEFTINLLNNSRNSRVIRIEAINKAVDYLIKNKEEESVRLSQQVVAKRIKIFLEQNPLLPEDSWDITKFLFNRLTYTHPRAVWASMRRDGHWSNFDVYYYLGSGTRQVIQKQSSKIYSELDGILNNMLGDDGLEPSHAFLTELRLNWQSWQSIFLNRVQQIGNLNFRKSLDEDPFWNECANLYGYGLEFREEVSDRLKSWFENDLQRPLFELLKSRIQKAWQEEVLDKLRKLTNETDV